MEGLAQKGVNLGIKALLTGLAGDCILLPAHIRMGTARGPGGAGHDQHLRNP